MYIQVQTKGTLDGRLGESVHRATSEDYLTINERESVNGELLSEVEAC